MNDKELEYHYRKFMKVMDMVEKEVLEQAVMSPRLIDDIKKFEALKLGE